MEEPAHDAKTGTVSNKKPVAHNCIVLQVIVLQATPTLSSTDT